MNEGFARCRLVATKRILCPCDVTSALQMMRCGEAQGAGLIVPAVIKARGCSGIGIQRFGLVHQGQCRAQQFGVAVLSKDKIHIFFLTQLVNFQTRKMRIATQQDRHVGLGSTQVGDHPFENRNELFARRPRARTQNRRDQLAGLPFIDMQRLVAITLKIRIE